MTFDEWVARSIPMNGAEYTLAKCAFAAGAASRDAEIAELVAALKSAREMIGHPDNIAIIDEALAKVRKS